MSHRWIDRETFDRLLTDMTRVRRLARDPEIVAGQHNHLGFVALIRHGDASVVLLDAALRPDRCFGGPEPCRSTALQLPAGPVRRGQGDHRSKPTSIAFLALGAFVAVNWGLGLGWLAFKIAGAAIALGTAVLSYVQP